MSRTIVLHSQDYRCIIALWWWVITTTVCTREKRWVNILYLSTNLIVKSDKSKNPMVLGPVLFFSLIICKHFRKFAFSFLLQKRSGRIPAWLGYCHNSLHCHAEHIKHILKTILTNFININSIIPGAFGAVSSLTGERIVGETQSLGNEWNK